MKSASVRRDDDLDDDADADVDDLDRDDDEPAVAAAAESAPVREGLPPTYRMRHEPHYVETLVAPPARGHAGPAADRRRPPWPSRSRPRRWPMASPR